ncbi:MAG TPA: OsmC family protein [Anaerolineaceae bacterium]|nr:OsmC family protein [Anaerolineaceae bacterium]HPN52478.1 OsmC family protein [Anaerolineaceae bacterium]
MASSVVRWVTGKQFVGTDSGKHSIVLSTGDEGVGMKPSELVLVGLSACTAVDVVEILAKKRLTLTGLEILASGEQDAAPPWAYRKIHLLYRLSGPDLTAEAVEKAIELSESKYCSVAATLRGVAEITTSFEIVPAL